MPMRMAETCESRRLAASTWRIGFVAMGLVGLVDLVDLVDLAGLLGLEGSTGAAEPPAPMNASLDAPLQTHLERATALIIEQRFGDACVELGLAYDDNHDAMLLLRIGRLRQRLGENEAAIAAYKRYLAEAVAPHAALKSEAEDALRKLEPPPPPLPPIFEIPPLAPPPIFGAPPLETGEPIVKGPPRRNKRLMKIGSLLFAAGYLPALVIPLAYSGSLDDPNAPTPAANYTLLIPLAGPFVSGIIAPASNQDGHGGQVFSSWSAPWMLTSGLLQVTGFTLLVFGSLRR